MSIWIILKKFLVSQNDFSHLLQEWGLFCVWIYLCRLRHDESENFFWQESHKYGFSRVFIRLWRIKQVNCANFTLQEPHWKGFSLLCELVHVLLIDRIVANLMGQLENGIIENFLKFEIRLYLNSI